MAGLQPIDFHDVLEDWVIRRNPDALSELQVYIEPLATRAASRNGVASHLQREFSFWVMTWLYERSESAHRRGKDTDPLSGVYRDLHESIEKEPSLKENLAGQQDVFSRKILSALLGYAFPDFWRSLERTGEAPRRAPKNKKGAGDSGSGRNDTGETVPCDRIPKPLFISLENWHIGKSDIETEVTYGEDGERQGALKEWELIPASNSEDQEVDKRIALLSEHVAKQNDEIRVTVRLRCYNLLRELTEEDMAYIVQRHKGLPASERLLDVSADLGKLRDLLLKELSNLAVTRSESGTPYRFIDRLLDCKPGTANTRVFRFTKTLKAKG